MQTVPSKSVAIGRNLGNATARGHAEFEVEARNQADRPSRQSGDTITVKFSAPASSTVADVADLGEGRYKIVYTAPIPGNYQMTVKMNGENIVGSPFKLAVKPPRAQAELCTLNGKGLTRVTAGEIGTFTIGFVDKHGNQAPPEELDIRVKPAGSADLARDENGDLLIDPQVQKTFDSFDEDGSGDIDFSELRRALAQLGMEGDRKATAVLLRRYDSDGGGLSIQEFMMLVTDIKIAAQTGYLLRGVTPAAEKGFREVKYEVRVAGEYEMSVGFSAASGGGNLTGSPFALTVHPAKASAEATSLPAHLVASGVLSTAVGESGYFVVQACDVYKNACTRGGDKVRVSAPDALTVRCEDVGDGTYKIHYQGDESGIHRMDIKVGDKEGAHIKGSPLSVACEPGPIHVASCELLHSGEAQSTTAGTRLTMRVRARDRFGNETANVLGGAIGFTVQMRRLDANGGSGNNGGGADGQPSEAAIDLNEAPGAGAETKPERTDGGAVAFAPVTAPSLGMMERCDGEWLSGGIYEITFVPASRGDFNVHVMCTQAEDAGAAARAAAPAPTGGGGGGGVRGSGGGGGVGGGGGAGGGGQQWRLQDVAAFLPVPLHVEPLGPDASSSLLTNSHVYARKQLRAGTRLHLKILLRDKYHNPCAWADPFGGVPDLMMHPGSPDNSPQKSSPQATKTSDGGVGGTPPAPPHPRGPELTATIFPFGGVALSSSEAKPHAMPIEACDESIGEYEARHVLGRSGRFSIVFELGGEKIGGSPLRVDVVGGHAAGLKSRLLLPEPEADGGDARLVMDEEGEGGEDGAWAAATRPVIGRPFVLSLKSRDLSGNAVRSGGAPVEVAVEEPPIEAGSEADHILAAKLECAVNDLDTGVYEIALTCANAGIHVVVVRLHGVEVIGSPLTLTAVKPMAKSNAMTAGKSRGETLYAVASAIANAGISWGFKHWTLLSYERHDLVAWLRRVAYRIVNLDAYWAFHEWFEGAAIVREAKAELTKAVNSLQKQMQRRVMNTWIDWYETRVFNGELMTRALGALQSIPVRSAFNTWYALVNGSFRSADEETRNERRQSVVTVTKRKE